ncbi:tRNA (adenosine(37)-N6)-threonylcarbamoyltransferase complex ATPase subunit type 1 TsaE [Lunatibacter salilacus]|uniref:tRNA (adenosine(37)-N6)-threonylcarbamoyltransferase complex ATPase subunit type 1 TsaE n=1 Tax=Lunatibacter salilacus TaxID=2483804 RepID=UPI00131CAE2E|nr:tRNA (adenosine(37)-N6)-threonylcarbamoyltransferase complex ATPase subunit type 1 TsaE [Lunatibacter salilacus]
MKKIRCNHLDQISECAKFVIDLSRHSPVWVFQGAMGAGKTTLIKAIASEMGVVDIVHSPTYGLVNEYEDLKGNSYYHFDFYRIEDLMEAVDMGVEEYFDSGKYCWIEWPEKIEGLLPEEFMKISIREVDRDIREICIMKQTNGGSK